MRLFGADSLLLTRTHAKFALLSAGDYRIAIRSSMNLNRNTRVEQFDLDDDSALYDWFMGLVDEIRASVPHGLDVPAASIAHAFEASMGGGAPVVPEVYALQEARQERVRVARLRVRAAREAREARVKAERAGGGV